MVRKFLTESVYGDLLERPTKREDCDENDLSCFSPECDHGRCSGTGESGQSSSGREGLVLEVTVPAPLNAVWEAFTTSAGLSTWLTPGAVVDLKEGGEWTAHFPGGSTGGGTILSFVPEKELVLSAMAPDRFPTVRATRTKARFQFEAKGDSTIVRLTQTGWKEGEEWVKAYEYLTVGNAQLLATLHHRFVNGPIDWTK
jgi:uncharacterized protein YndB with AHSA1/START domain